MEFWTNTFCYLDKYISQFEQMYLIFLINAIAWWIILKLKRQSYLSSSKRKNVNKFQIGLQHSVGEGFCKVVLQIVSCIYIPWILSNAFLWFQKCISECSFLLGLSAATIVVAIGREMSSLWCCTRSFTELYFLSLTQTKYKIQN